ncbi:hypothetical protein ACFQT0_27485 [Hymenobacter humi]|uniref:Uncharacterized protein n=1 Tax=Hymenobacter humi TaxID=1411620 RepID=A0ABW2UAJ3_9BACT
MASCRPDADLAPQDDIPGATVPANFPAPTYRADQNPPTRAAFEPGPSLVLRPAAFAHGHRVVRQLPPAIGSLR